MLVLRSSWTSNLTNYSAGTEKKNKSQFYQAGIDEHASTPHGSVSQFVVLLHMA